MMVGAWEVDFLLLDRKIHIWLSIHDAVDDHTKKVQLTFMMTMMMSVIPTKLLCVNMRSMRPSAKGVVPSPSVYISVTTCNQPVHSVLCSGHLGSVLFRCLSANFSALVTYWLTTVFATCWVKSVGTNVESLWMVVVHTSMRCILDHGRGKVCEWGRGNGAYWIDGVEEAHRQMVPHQGNLNRHLPSSSWLGFTAAAILSVFDWWSYSGRSTLHNSCNC